MVAPALLGSLLVLGLLVALVVVLLGRASRRGDPGGERAGPSLRRFLQYGFLLGAAMVAASGVTLLVMHALPAGPLLAGPATRDLALGLSATLVGVAVWLGLWRLVVRRLAHDPGERASLAWTLYLAAAATVALIVALVNLVRVGAWATGASDFEAAALAAAVVWSALWGLHAWLARQRSLAPAGALADLAVLAGSAVGLVALALGAAGVLSFGLEQVYRAVTRAVLADAVTTETLRRDLVLTLVAAGAWWWHWLRSAASATRSTLWHVHVVLLGILGGLLTATVGAAVLLHAVLEWLAGVREAAGAAAHFETLPGALTAVAVGGWSWWYHRSVIGAGGDRRRRTEPERTCAYLAAAVGLVAATAGVTAAIVAAVLASATPPLASADPGGRETLVVALTLLGVGAPLWGPYWWRLQRRVGAGEAGERQAPSRRAYLFLVFGAGGLTAAASAAVMLFVFFRDLLEGALGPASLYDLRVALALALSAGGVSGYHWTVYREDRASRCERTLSPHTVVLVSAGGRDLAERVAARTGATVRTLHRLDGDVGDGVDTVAVDPETLAAAILASAHERVLVVVDGDGALRVIPYESR